MYFRIDPFHHPYFHEDPLGPISLDKLSVRVDHPIFQAGGMAQNLSARFPVFQKVKKPLSVHGVWINYKEVYKKKR